MYKILNINNYHYPRGGSDSYFMQLSQLLKSEGHQIATFSSDRGTAVNQQLMITDPVKGVDTEGAKSLSNIANFMYSLDAKRKLRQAIEKFKPDIAHLHIYYGQLTSSILAILDEYDIPIVQTLHEFKLVCPTQGLFAKGQYCESCNGHSYWQAAYRRCNKGSFARSMLSMSEAYLADLLGARRKVDRFIAVSEFQKNKLIELGIDQNKLSLLHHFSDKMVAAEQNRGDYFLYVGRIHEDKGIKTLLDSYDFLKKDLLKNRSENGLIPLKIVGDGTSLHHWQNYAESLGISENIQWLGYQQGSPLSELYKNSLVLINPSRLNETFGLTCLEAFARGKSVIASRVGAFPEVISDTEDGVLFETDNVGELAKIMGQFISGELDALAMGKKALDKVNTDFNREKHYHGLMNIYQAVIK